MQIGTGSIAVMVACVATMAACDLPRDPNRTTERVRVSEIRVGVVEHPPWVTRSGDEPAGVEVTLVRRLAHQLATDVTWVWGGEDDQMRALEADELDLVIAGLTDDTPWRGTVGLTDAYVETRVAVGVPAMAAV